VSTVRARVYTPATITPLISRHCHTPRPSCLCPSVPTIFTHHATYTDGTRSQPSLRDQSRAHRLSEEYHLPADLRQELDISDDIWQSTEPSVCQTYRRTPSLLSLRHRTSDLRSQPHSLTVRSDSFSMQPTAGSYFSRTSTQEYTDPNVPYSPTVSNHSGTSDGLRQSTISRRASRSQSMMTVPEQDTDDEADYGQAVVRPGDQGLSYATGVGGGGWRKGNGRSESPSSGSGRGGNLLTLGESLVIGVRASADTYSLHPRATGWDEGGLGHCQVGRVWSCSLEPRGCQLPPRWLLPRWSNR
jgi:hypothetical protein